MLKNSFYQNTPPLNRMNYQIVPILSQQKNNVARVNYQYVTPDTSPIKYTNSINPTNPHVTPTRVPSSLLRNHSQYICKTTEKRNESKPALTEKEKTVKNMTSEPHQTQGDPSKYKEMAERNEFLTKKLEILLKENTNLNSMINDMGKDLLETKEKLSQALRKEIKTEDFASLNQSNEDLEQKIVILTKENEKLIKMVEMQNREESTLRLMEEKIDGLLGENSRLTMLLKKEREYSFEIKRKYGDVNKNSSLDYENKVLQIKMQELQKKLEVILEDNNKMENILRNQQVEFQEMRKQYEKDLEKNSHQETQIKELLIKLQDFKDAYKKLLLESDKDKISKITEENVRLKEKNSIFEKMLLSLIEENSKLNDCMSQILVSKEERNDVNGGQILKTIKEENLGESERNNLLEENQKLRKIIEEKESLEKHWKNKFMELEKKIKNLF